MAFAPQLCPQAKADPFSDRVNYYFGATLGQPTFFRLNRVPSVTVFTSRASEFKAFRRETAFGTVLSLNSRPGSRLPSTLTYQFELGRTEADEVVFCLVFQACSAPRREAFARTLPLGALGYTILRDRTDNPLAPTTGSLQRLTLRHASALTGSDPTQRFNKVVADASRYWRLGGQDVLIAHVQLGSLLGRNGGSPPQQERLYAGGPTTVRGFRQNELGPVVYLVPTYETVAARGDTVYFRDTLTTRPDRTIPTGGNSLLVGNLELQLRSPVLPEILQLALFTDAGEVWERGNPAAAFRGLRVTPGAGVRVKSLFGVIRVDVGYNPYPSPEGAAYYINTTSGRALYCVSPRNTLPVTGVESGVPVQAGGSCPATFQPSTPPSFLKRLNPSIWIGNAF
jgi:outer membrane protein insertion porin family/translocation and assembly module TamA